MDHLGGCGAVYCRSGLCKTNEEKITLLILSSSYETDGWSYGRTDASSGRTRLVQNENQRALWARDWLTAAPSRELLWSKRRRELCSFVCALLFLNLSKHWHFFAGILRILNSTVSTPAGDPINAMPLPSPWSLRMAMTDYETPTFCGASLTFVRSVAGNLQNVNFGNHRRHPLPSISALSVWVVFCW